MKAINYFFSVLFEDAYHEIDAHHEIDATAPSQQLVRGK